LLTACNKTSFLKETPVEGYRVRYLLPLVCNFFFFSYFSFSIKLKVPLLVIRVYHFTSKEAILTSIAPFHLSSEDAIHAMTFQSPATPGTAKSMSRSEGMAGLVEIARPP